MLARLHKLAAQSDSLSPEQKQALATARTQIDTATGRLPSHYQALLLREARARLNSLNWFLDDCNENRRECRVQYPFEIRNRQRIAEICKALEANSADAVATQVASIDQQLQSMLTSGDFIWESSVAHVYRERSIGIFTGCPPDRIRDAWRRSAILRHGSHAGFGMRWMVTSLRLWKSWRMCRIV